MHPSGSIVFISSRAPWNSGAPLACLDAMMTTAVFDVPVQLVLLGEGILQLMQHQDGTALGSRNLSKMFGALGLYGVTTIHVDRRALQAYGLALADLLQAEDCETPLQLTPVEPEDIRRLISHSKAVFNF